MIEQFHVNLPEDKAKLAMEGDWIIGWTVEHLAEWLPTLRKLPIKEIEQEQKPSNGKCSFNESNITFTCL